MIVDLPISLNLLFNFSKQATTVVASKRLRKPLFRLLAAFSLLDCISEISTPICDTDAITHVSAIFHDAISTTTTRTSRVLLHLNQIVTSVTLQMAWLLVIFCYILQNRYFLRTWNSHSQLKLCIFQTFSPIIANDCLIKLLREGKWTTLVKR